MIEQIDTAQIVTASRKKLFFLRYLPVWIALVAVLLAAYLTDREMTENRREEARVTVAEHLGIIRAQLEGNINGNIRLLQGLVGALETEPDMSQDRFSDLSYRIFRRSPQIRNVAAARDYVVNLVYPLEANKAVIGLDYRKNPIQRDAALMVRNATRPIVTGPVRLVQGGEGLIARMPAYYENGEGALRFWGIVSAVMDIDALYRDSGLAGEALDINVAISARAPDGAVGEPFFGDSFLFDKDPVRMVIRLGHEDWIIGGTPLSGWEGDTRDLWIWRGVIAMGALIILTPMVWVSRLMGERERNLVELRMRDNALVSISKRLEMAVETSEIGIWEMDVGSGALVWDKRMRELYGISPDKVIDTYSDWEQALHPEDREKAKSEFSQALDSEGRYVSDFRIRSDGGSIRHIRAFGTTYRDAQDNQKILGVNLDVTDDLRLQEELRDAKIKTENQNRELERARLNMEHAALHDALTGLPNRRFLDRVLQEREATDGEAKSLTVLHIDLDRFKDINDTLGHAAGDTILRHAAETLRATISESDFLARIGGDEFVVISGPDREGADYHRLAEQLVDAMSRPVDFEGHECRIGASIGIARWSADGEGVAQALINADIALYESKKRGRNRVEVFSEGLRQTAIHTKRTADEILRGLEQNEFVAWFQPQFDARTLDVIGLEALARWDHPTLGIRSPAEFLPIAESLKAVSAIDDIVLTQAMLQRHRLAAMGFHIPKVSVNISAQRLQDETLIPRLEALSIQPGTLSIELLESISFEDDDQGLVQQINRIKDLGIDIEIDDFGTGHASIVTLLKLTPRRLKIDRQIIKPIAESQAQRQLVKSIIEIGKSRGIEIVAEGVETVDHVAILRELGCDILQGYAFSAPLSPLKLPEFLRKREWQGTIEAKVA